MDYLFLIPKISGSIVEVPKIIEEGFGDNDSQVFTNFKSNFNHSKSPMSIRMLVKHKVYGDLMYF